MPKLDYGQAGKLLSQLFAEAEKARSAGTPPTVPSKVVKATDALFASATQAYREALLGAGLIHLLDPALNLRHPYTNHGPDAFNGRTLDTKVINPFLSDRMIPSSKGPYLSAFRRSVKFLPATASGLRDKPGYQAMLDYITALEKAADEAETRALVVYLLYRFILLRDAADIPLVRISRFSLEQTRELIGELLEVQSGGLIPVLLTVATLRTLAYCYELDWTIESQGINVADSASSASGDVTVKDKDDAIVLAIEVTERPIEKARVVSTFNTKIARAGISDYLFVYSNNDPSDDALEVAQTYFSQGHEINFVNVEEWIVNNLGTMTGKCRAYFTKQLLELFQDRSVPAAIKVALNDIVTAIINA